MAGGQLGAAAAAVRGTLGQRGDPHAACRPPAAQATCCAPLPGPQPATPACAEAPRSFAPPCPTLPHALPRPCPTLPPQAKKYFDEYLGGAVEHTDCGSAQPYHWGGLTHGSNVGEARGGGGQGKLLAGRQAAGICVHWCEQERRRAAHAAPPGSVSPRMPAAQPLHACLLPPAPTPAQASRTLSPPLTHAAAAPQPPWACAMPRTRRSTATTPPAWSTTASSRWGGLAWGCCSWMPCPALGAPPCSLLRCGSPRAAPCCARRAAPCRALPRRPQRRALPASCASPMLPHTPTQPPAAPKPAPLPPAPLSPLPLPPLPPAPLPSCPPLPPFAGGLRSGRLRAVLDGGLWREVPAVPSPGALLQLHPGLEERQRPAGGAHPRHVSRAWAQGGTGGHRGAQGGTGRLQGAAGGCSGRGWSEPGRQVKPQAQHSRRERQGAARVAARGSAWGVRAPRRRLSRRQTACRRPLPSSSRLQHVPGPPHR